MPLSQRRFMNISEKLLRQTHGSIHFYHSTVLHGHLHRHRSRFVLVVGPCCNMGNKCQSRNQLMIVCKRVVTQSIVGKFACVSAQYTDWTIDVYHNIIRR